MSNQSERSTYRSTKQSQEPITWWSWTALGILTLFFVIAPFKYALFNGTGVHSSSQNIFEHNLLVGILDGVLALIVVGIMMFGFKNCERRHLVSWVGIFLPLVYVISSFQAASPHLSKIWTLMAFLSYSFLILGVFMAEKQKMLNAITYIILITGYIVVLIGFMFLFQNVYLFDAVQFANGVRLASFFTYPNALASFLLTLLLGNLLLLVKTQRKWEAVFHGGMLVPILTSLLLTLSRGAIIMLPFIALAALLMFNFRRQLLVLVHFIVATLLSLLILGDITDRATSTYNRIQASLGRQVEPNLIGIFARGSIGGWARLGAASIVMAIISYLVIRWGRTWLETRVKKVELRKAARLYMPAIAVALSVLGVILLISGVLKAILPIETAGRLTTINWQTQSVYERLTFYKDAWNIWKDHKLFGAGGGGWEALYDQYQSYPYTSAQTHSYPIQLLVDTGLVGFVIAIVYILYIIVSYLKRFFNQEQEMQDSHLFYYLVVISVLLHSLIDFDMSYAYFGGLVFFALGVLAGQQREPMLTGIQESSRIWMNRCIAGISIVVGIAVGIYTLNMIYADNQIRKGDEYVREGRSLEEIEATLAKGLKRDNNPFLLERLAGMQLDAFNQTQQSQYLDVADKYLSLLQQVEPHYRSLGNMKYDLLEKEGNKEESVKWLDQMIQKYPFEITYYEQAVMDHFSLWTQAYQSGDEETAAAQEKAILDIYDMVENKVQKLNKLPEGITYPKPFLVTTNMRLFVGEIHYFNGRYDQAVNTLQPALEEDSNDIKRFYVASLSKLGKDDETVYKQLVTDPTEEQKLKQLLER